MKYKIFVDLDGVLADFDKGVEDLTGHRPEDPNKPMRDDAWMWNAIEKKPNFYANLSLMSDARKLWSYLKHFNPTVLTGLPLFEGAARDKRDWVAKHFGTNVPVICCRSKDKIVEAKKVTPAGKTPLLIDDLTKYRPIWEAGGGTYVLHTSAEATVHELHRLLS